MTTSRPSSTTSSPEVRCRGLVDGTLTVAWIAGLSLLRGRRGLILLLVAMMPLIPVVASWYREDANIKGILGFAATVSEHYFRLVNLLVCLFLGSAAIGEEVEGGTLPYLLLRAVPRTALLLGRYLAYLANTMVLLGGCYLLCYGLTVGQMGVEALWVDLPFVGHTLLGLFLAVAAYGALFILLSVLFKRPLLIGLGFLFLWEAWAATGPGPIADYTILHHVYVLLFQWTYLQPFQELSLWEWGQLPEDSPGGALLALTGIVTVGLTLACWRFRVREFSA